MKLRLALAGAWTLAVLIACSVPGEAIPTFDLFSADKLYHLAAFIGYGLLWLWAGVRPRTVLITGIAFAVGTELWQGLPFIGRFSDPFDALADVAGVGLALLTWRTAKRAQIERAEQR